MAIFKACALAAGALFIAGCAVHPLPEDYSGVSTFQIVRQIRCEARAAAADSIFNFLTNDVNFEHGMVDSKSREVGFTFKGSRELLPKFKPEKLSGNARKIVGQIWSTGIAYNYNLQMTENNTNDLSLDLLHVLKGSTKDALIHSNLDLQRQNTRVFSVTDTIEGLIAGTPVSVNPIHDYCSPKYLAPASNIIYPIAGKIGIKPVLDEFINLAIFANLAGDATGENISKPKGPSQLAEQLGFTTTLEFSTNPTVLFTPVAQVVHLKNGGISFDAKRVDLHKLTIGLYVPTTAELAKSRGQIIESVAAGALIGPLASAPRGTSAGEIGALRAVNELLKLKLFQLTQ